MRAVSFRGRQRRRPNDSSRALTSSHMHVPLAACAFQLPEVRSVAMYSYASPMASNSSSVSGPADASSRLSSLVACSSVSRAALDARLSGSRSTSSSSS